MRTEPFPPSALTFAPASPEAIGALVSKFPRMPSDYTALLAQSNGLEGAINAEPGWLVLWPVEEVMVASEECGLTTELPDYVAIGGDGGNELFLVRSSLGDMSPVYRVPMIGMSEAVVLKVAADFRHLLGSFEESNSAEG